MVSFLEEENSQSDVARRSKKKIVIPSLESVVSSGDEDSEDPVGKEDGRDDNTIEGVINYLNESRNDLMAHVEAGIASASSTFSDTPACVAKATDSAFTVSKSTSKGDTENIGGPLFDTLCVQPYDMFVQATGAPASDTKKEIGASAKQRKVTEDQGNNDAEDEGSVVSMGKLFDDLASLPSLASMGVKIPIADENEQSLLAAAVDDLTLSDIHHDTMTNKTTEVPDTQSLTEPISSFDSVSLEKTLEKKLKESYGREDAVLSDDEVTSDCSYSGSRQGSLPRVRSLSSRTTVSDSTALTDEQPTADALVKQLRAARGKHGRHHVKCATLTSALGDELYKCGHYEKAFGMYKDALSAFSTKLGDSNVTTIECRLRLGETLDKLGKYDAAIQEYHSVYEMRKGLNGDKDATVADALVMISKALRQKEGRVSQALKELKKALKMYRTCLGDSDPKVAAVVDDIASLYIMTGNYEKAAAILDEVVKLKAAIGGMYTTEVADTLTQLALAQQATGDTDNALKSLKKAYSINTSVSGDDSAETTESLRKLARFYMETQDYQKAINACMGVLNRKKRTLGNADPSLADTYVDLGMCLQQTGDLNKASKCLKLALTLCIGAKGSTMRESSTIAHIMHELGVIHQLNGRTKDAIKVFKQELVVRKKMSKEDPAVARTLFYLGTAKYDIGDYTPALTYLTEALSIYEKNSDNFGMDFAETLFSTGLVFKTTKHDERARQAFLESLKLFYAHGLGNDHELVKMATTKLKELGHKCECKHQVCAQVPCQSLSAYV